MEGNGAPAQEVVITATGILPDTLYIGALADGTGIDPNITIIISGTSGTFQILPAPGLAVTADTGTGTERTLTVRVVPGRAVRLVYLGVEPGVHVRRAVVAGRVVSGDPTGFLFHAPPAGGVEMTLTLDRSGPVLLRVMDGSDGLDGLPGFHPRPDGVGIDGSHTSELVVVAATVTV